jgi:hypothetical protein
MKDGVNRESSGDAAESETLSMRGNSMRENRDLKDSLTGYRRGTTGEGI